MKIERTPIPAIEREMYAPVEIVERWSALDGEAEAAVVHVSEWAERRWVWFTVHTLSPAKAVRVLLAMRSYLARQPGPIYTALDLQKFPDAERLDTVLGFEPTDYYVRKPDESGDSMRVWMWQKLQR